MTTLTLLPSHGDTVPDPILMNPSAYCQVNNCLAVPGFGSGCIARGSNEVTTAMQLAAAAAIAGLVTAEELGEESILPRIGRLEEVALAVCKAVVDAGN